MPQRQPVPPANSSVPPPRTRRGASRLRVAAGLTALLVGALLAPAAATGAVAAEPSNALFDDFQYGSRTDAALNDRWTLRSGGGGPGLSGVSWSPDKISFQDRDGSRVMRLEVSSQGAASNTVQAEIYTPERKFREGTYAARVKFTDAPVYGPDGDHVVQTFFSITPLRYDYDPEYGELDFEYLPNGGWAGPQAFYLTSWETYRADPWDARKDYDQINRSFAGWHDLVLTLDAHQAVYYIDGVEVARHYPPNLPKSEQTINVNLWLINDGVLPTGEARAYEQLVDWVYFAEDTVLTPAQVAGEVRSFRSSGVTFQDTVGSGNPGGGGPGGETPGEPGEIRLAGFCLDVPGAQAYDGNQAQVATCNGNAAQDWTRGANGSVSALGTCLHVKDHATADGTPVVLWSCNGSPGQEWVYDAGAQSLRNPYTGKCLDASGGTPVHSGQPLIVWPCHGGVNQRWTIH